MKTKKNSFFYFKFMIKYCHIKLYCEFKICLLSTLPSQNGCCDWKPGWDFMFECYIDIDRFIIIFVQAALLHSNASGNLDDESLSVVHGQMFDSADVCFYSIFFCCCCCKINQCIHTKCEFNGSCNHCADAACTAALLLKKFPTFAHLWHTYNIMDIKLTNSIMSKKHLLRKYKNKTISEIKQYILALIILKLSRWGEYCIRFERTHLDWSIEIRFFVRISKHLTVHWIKPNWIFAINSFNQMSPSNCFEKSKTKQNKSHSSSLECPYTPVNSSLIRLSIRARIQIRIIFSLVFLHPYQYRYRYRITIRIRNVMAVLRWIIMRVICFFFVV